MQFPANIDLTTLNGKNGFRLDNPGSSGNSVAWAGDVNGDGFADVIVGVSYSRAYDQQAGASYVVFGSAEPFDTALDLDSLDGANGFKLSGVAADDKSGASVASAGDINGDGLDDLIVGAPSADAHGEYSGASYVVFGKAAGFAPNLDLSTLNGTDGFKLSGVAADDHSGASVASAGDVNGDGFADLIVGAPGAEGYSGASYVVFGKAAGFAANLDLSTLNGANGFKLTGSSSSGSSVASAGDVNGDGFADMIVGSPFTNSHGSQSGASYVVFGKAKGFGANIDLTALNGANGFKLSGAAERDHSGHSVASAGDVNGDGFGDVIVGAYSAGPHGEYSGASYVVFGKAKGFSAHLDLSTLNGTNGFKLSGAAEFDRAGQSVASAGDVNGDGFADLIVGAPGVEYRGESTGASYVIFGKADGFDANLDLSSLDGANGFKLTRGYIGNSVSSAGDVNRDGFADLVVSSWAFHTGYVVFGIKPDAAVARVGTNASQTLAGGDFNDGLAGRAGDDTLWGNAGKDKLAGEDGNDTLKGGLGNDIVTGGADQDAFVFDTELSKKKNVDKILDFSHKQDTILLDLAVFEKLKSEGELKAKFFGIGKEAGDKNDYILYDKKSGALSYDADGSKAKIKAVQFASLDDDLKLKADDFLVI